MNELNRASKAQKRRIFALLHTLQMTDNRDVIVAQFTDERTGHVGEMYDIEADKMIAFLEHKAQFGDPSIDWAMGRIGLEIPPRDPKTTIKTGLKHDPKTVILNTKPAFNNDEKAVKMRKKILHILGLYGMVTGENKLDYDRINDFIVNIGSRNPDKKQLNYLTNSELVAIVTQVEQMVYQPKKRIKQ
jgi:hypothetical protein